MQQKPTYMEKMLGKAEKSEKPVPVSYYISNSIIEHN